MSPSLVRVDQNTQRIADLERRVAELEEKLDDLARLLKRAESFDDVQRAGRRAQ